MCEKRNGVIAGAFFAIGHGHKLVVDLDLLVDTRRLGIPEPAMARAAGLFSLLPAGQVKALWITEVLGVEPFHDCPPSNGAIAMSGEGVGCDGKMVGPRVTSLLTRV